jgi:hypothetical protein
MSSFGQFGVAPKATPREYSGPHGVSETFEKAKREMGIPARSEQPDFTITEVTALVWGPHDRTSGGLRLYWSTRSAGFGIFGGVRHIHFLSEGRGVAL